MPSPSLAWSSLVLAAGLVRSPPQKRWKPLLRLHEPPAHQRGALGDRSARRRSRWRRPWRSPPRRREARFVRLKAELGPAESGAAWHLELFVGGDDKEKPKRVNLQVSARRAEGAAPARAAVDGRRRGSRSGRSCRKRRSRPTIAIELCKERAARRQGRADARGPAHAHARVRSRGRGPDLELRADGRRRPRRRA